MNSDTPNGRTPGTSVDGGVVENNGRDTEALAWFVEHSFEFGDLTVTPGLRREDIDYGRRNKLNGATGATNVTETLAGIGAAWRIVQGMVVFAGVHEGFSPPRVEDIINNSNGASLELDAESSINSELGLRYTDAQFNFEAALFRMDFDNQIVPASVAGGAGATLTSAGETLHSGMELLATWEFDSTFSKGAFSPFASLTWTWVREAEYRDVPTSSVTPGVNVNGNRLPYTPEYTWSLTGGIALREGLRAQLEAAYVDEMFTDDLNTVLPVANGQRGLISDNTIYNLSVNFRMPGSDWTVFLASKNLTDKVYVVDASRGLIPGMQRTWQAGIEWQF